MSETGNQNRRTNANLDPGEVERFARMADDWWNANGKFRPLHQIGPSRLAFIRDNACAVHNRDPDDTPPLGGLTALDIGCGGGLICEPLTRLGATVTGIDPAGSGIEAARIHAEQSRLKIDYRNVSAETLVEENASFDIVLALEVIEHVPDPAAFAATCATLVGPGGMLVMSTINRTLKAYALAIVGAEYILRWLPRGTHHWEKFVTPDELTSYLSQSGMPLRQKKGIVYNPLKDEWRLSEDTDVNYLVSATRTPDRNIE